MSSPPILPPVDGGDLPYMGAVGALLDSRPAVIGSSPPPPPAGRVGSSPSPPADDDRGRRLLEACAAGQEISARTALSAGADPTATDGAGRTALHLVSSGRHGAATTARLVRLLRGKGAPLEATDAKGRTPVLEAADAGNTAALLTLAELGAACDAADQRGNTLLHLAAGSGNPQTVAAALSRLPAEAVHWVNKAGDTPLHLAKNRETARSLLAAGAQADEPITLMLLERMPSAMIYVFNHYITTNGQPLDSSHLEVYLNYTPFCDANRKDTAPETGLLRAIVNANRDELLKHPLVETFMHVKWLQIRRFFYFNFAFYVCFALLVTTYGLLRVIQPDESLTRAVGWVTAAFTVLTGLRELLQLTHGLRLYFTTVENWLELIVLALNTALLATPGARHAWVHHAVAWLMLATWLELTLMVGRLPNVGIYIYMFVRVAQNLTGFLLVYSPLLVAFALSFRVMFGETDAFKSIPLSLIKTFVMMMGEYEYNSVFIDDIPLYLGTSHILMVLFIVSMPIIIVNLLIGLTVNDIQSVFMMAGVQRLRITVTQIVQIESIVYSNILHKICCTQFYLRYLKKLTVLPKLFFVTIDKHVSEGPNMAKGALFASLAGEPSRVRRSSTRPEQCIVRAGFRPNVRDKPRLYRRDSNGELQPSGFVMHDWMLQNMLRLLQEREDRAEQERSELQLQAQRLAELRTSVALTASVDRHLPEQAAGLPPGESGGPGRHLLEQAAGPPLGDSGGPGRHLLEETAGPPPGQSGGPGRYSADRLEQKLDTVLAAVSELSLRLGLLERQRTSPDSASVDTL